MKNCFLFLLIIASLSAPAQNFSTQSLAAINSVYDDQNPVLSPDGKRLYLTIANHPQNIGGKKDPGDIWISTWTENRWSAPVHGGPVLNDRNYNAIAGFAPDGSQIFLLSHYDKNGEPAKTQGLSYAKKTAAGWSAPENISIPYFLNKSLLISGQVSNDGSVFVYSAEAYDTKGAEDLYVAKRNRSGSWDEPRNLGVVINTAFQELSPSLSADMKYLYFSSNGRKGYGSFDVYFAERLDDTWLNWSLPVNMGSRINTEGRELFYHTYPKFNLALFTSTQNSDGYGDIKPYLDSIHSNLPDTAVRIVEIKREDISGEKKATLRGVVTNSKTGQPVVAKLDFKSDSTYGAVSTKQGKYTLQIPSTKVYTIVVEAPGYVGVLEKLDIHTFEMQQVELNFKLQPIEIGATVNLKNVLFQTGTTNLLTDSYDELNVVVDLLKSNPRIEIELAGHTDNHGDARQNLKLSQSRVDKVKAYLVSKGISAKRIQGKGYGGKRPITNSESEESRKLNRRVEFTIVKD
jgi:OOP family OmpA-OmpF porin